MIEVRDSGLVYRNPKPHLRADHTWHPSVVCLDNGDLLVAFDRGQGAESLDYRTWISRSTDAGKSWSTPVRLVEDPPGRCSTQSFRIGKASDGTLIALGAINYRNDPEEGLLNRANMGYVPMNVASVRSADAGQTWSKPAIVEPPLVGPGFEVCHSLVELKDGRWLWPTSTWRGWDGATPNGWKCVAFISEDKGRTWPIYLDIMNQWDRGVLSWEVGLVQLLDGRLLAVMWAYHLESGQTEPTPYAISSDGKTFGKPMPTGLLGQTAKLALLRDGRLLCLYRANGKPGLQASLVRIEGDKWHNVEQTVLWNGAPSGMEGKANRGDELSGLRFGYPQMTLLPDGDIFAVFWCMEDAIQNIRWLRLRIH